jgi:hypothetical protein
VAEYCCQPPRRWAWCFHDTPELCIGVNECICAAHTKVQLISRRAPQEQVARTLLRRRHTAKISGQRGLQLLLMIAAQPVIAAKRVCDFINVESKAHAIETEFRIAPLGAKAAANERARAR